MLVAPKQASKQTLLVLAMFSKAGPVVSSLQALLYAALTHQLPNLHERAWTMHVCLGCSNDCCIETHLHCGVITLIKH